jgi:hypothetical protein
MFISRNMKIFILIIVLISIPGGEWREFIPDQVFNGGNPGAPGEPGW